MARECGIRLIASSAVIVRRVAMMANLLVVLCNDRHMPPVITTGTVGR